MNNLTEIELYVIQTAKKLRLEAKLSQAELAFKMHVSSGFIGKVESNMSSAKYNLNHINDLAKIFNVSPKVFLPEKYI
jgi:transcriptional regulator with XRE-family HTH domain